MSYQEQQSIVNIFSGLLITAIFGWIVYQRQVAGMYDLSTDFQQWGKLFLLFAGISVGVRIVIMIIYHIIWAIATRQEDAPDDDERDKIIKLKATRNGHYAFIIPFVGAFAGLAFGMPVWGLFIAFIAAGLISEITENGSQIYYYRKGR